MKDLPYTSRELALKCKEITEESGLKRVEIGNEWLLRN